ncbi:MAG: hypothetical protein KC431_06160 [Myxococcales bacterium]|nr:hypothetical protein [Myxococcales bacterium]
MLRPRPLPLALISTIVLAAVPNTARAERVIDSFTNELPTQNLAGTGYMLPIVWAGTFNNVQQAQGSASQTGLDGVIGGRRLTTVTASSMSNFIYLLSNASTARLDYNTGYPTSGILELEYGYDVDLNANLVADGSVAFEFEIEGDMDSTPARPVELTVEVVSGSGAAIDQVTIELIDDGVYQIPFADFAGVDFSDVDYLHFVFDASQVQAVDFSLSDGIRTSNCLQAPGQVVADLFLDRFTSALPNRELPPYGTYPMMWVGTFMQTSKADDFAAQTGLQGVLGGGRDTTLEASDISNFITANTSSDNGTPLMSYATGYPTSGLLTLEYGAGSDLDADFSAHQAFEIELDGDLEYGPRPVDLEVTVVSGAGSDSAVIVLQSDGTFTIPFSAFPNVDFADVDYVGFAFDASAVQAIDFDLIGGLRATACVP